MNQQLEFAEIGSEAFRTLQKESGELSKAIDQANGSLVESSTLVQGLGRNFSQMLQNGQFSSEAFLNTIKAHFADLAVEGLLTALKIEQGYGKSLDNLSDMFGGWFKWLTSAFSNVGKWITDALSSIGSAFSSVFSSGGSGSGSFVSSALGIVGGLIGFDGGGHTGNGPRSGGMDGKGGFLAMMHPKETVIDHTKGAAPASASGAGSVVVYLTQNFDPSLTEAHVQSMFEDYGEASAAGIFEALGSSSGRQIVRRVI